MVQYEKGILNLTLCYITLADKLLMNSTWNVCTYMDISIELYDITFHQNQ